MGKTVSVTKGGQATIPKELREKFGIESPGRVKMEEGEEGVVIKAIEDPHQKAGYAKGMTDEQGRTATEIVDEERATDERFL